MPSAIASVTKRVFRQALSFRTGDYWPITSTSEGNAGRTTAVFASLIGQPATSIVNRYLLQIGATNTGEWRRITTFAPLTGTITVNRAFTAQTATAEASELHKIRPDLYTLAGNEAIYKPGNMIYREVDGFVIPNGNAMIGFPRGMRVLNRILRLGTQTVKDLFDRVDSTTTPGGSWLESSGAWGISSERLYSVDDADGDFTTLDIDLKDGFIRTILRADTTASNNRCAAPAFRIREDYLGAVDLTNCLRVRLLNGAVDLVKRDAGSDTTIATSTQTVTDSIDYQIEILWAGSRIRVWFDGIEIISYELLGTDLKYLDYPRAGIRLEKTGTPGAAARVDSFYAYSLDSTHIAVDYEAQADSLMIRIPGIGMHLIGDGRYTDTTVLWLQGQGRLTEMAADSTFEAIASDTTAVLEITATDPGLQLFLDEARYLLYEHAAQPGNTADSEERAEYAQQAELARAARASSMKLEMPQPAAHFNFPR